jgi:hypothetical protein
MIAIPALKLPFLTIHLDLEDATFNMRDLRMGILVQTSHPPVSKATFTTINPSSYTMIFLRTHTSTCSQAISASLMITFFDVSLRI